MISSATEGCSTGVYHSLGSLVNPSRGGINKRSCNSQPFMKPKLKKHQQLDFSLEDSRWFLKALAAELDRIVQLKDKTIESGVNTGEIKEEDGRTLILEWADERQSLQQKNKQKPMKVSEVLNQQASQDIKLKFYNAKRVLCDWMRTFITNSQDFNRPNFREVHKVVIKDLYKQWKKGHLVSILPVMDFTIRTMLLEDKCEESMFKSWFKTEQKFKKAGDMHVPDQVWRWIMKSSEDCSTGVYHNLGSLVNPSRGGKSKRSCNSTPFNKPNLKMRDQIVQKILKYLQFKEPKEHQQPDFSLDDSRCFLKSLAAELDRIVQDTNIESGVNTSEIKEEDGRTLILEWADEIQSLQQKNKQKPMKVPEELNQQASQDIKLKFHNAKVVLCDWMRTFITNSQDFNRQNFREEHKVVIKDLCEQWKKGHLVSILPVMDFTIRTMLLEDKCEESMFKSWFKTEQKFKKAGDMHVPDQVWRWIMKSSDKVALDPNTANPTLILSQDERSVRTRTYGESNPWSAHQRIHRQYDGWPCIQAKEGYLTGRHYWEVDVKGKCDWRIGVVKELAPRNGFVTMNTNSGYWTLRLQLGSLMALTNPVTKLDQANPSKIGVYLDVEEDQLSFYDTEKRKHIYTFKADFSMCGKIYPVFGTVETDKPLKIM